MLKASTNPNCLHVLCLWAQDKFHFNMPELLANTSVLEDSARCCGETCLPGDILHVLPYYIYIIICFEMFCLETRLFLCNQKQCLFPCFSFGWVRKPWRRLLDQLFVNRNIHSSAEAPVWHWCISYDISKPGMNACICLCKHMFANKTRTDSCDCTLGYTIGIDRIFLHISW